MKKSAGDTPIVIGRLCRQRDNFNTITGHTGDVIRLDENEYEILKEMNGFQSSDDISKKLNLSVEKVNKTFEKFKDNSRMVTTLKKWNRIGWCSKCHTYISGEKCGICNGDIEKIIFSPPCDPFICFDEERMFIVNALKDNFGIEIPEDTLLLAANGCENNKFFWDVAYNGQIVLRIIFTNLEKENWKYELLVDKEEIIKEIPQRLDERTWNKLFEANKQSQKKLCDTAKSLILEANEFFDNKQLIYFSGGKESLVMLNLYSELNLDANVLTVATGVDFPDDIEYTKKIRNELDVNHNFTFYFYEGDEEKILSRLKEEKLLSAKIPWCRNDFKEKLKNTGTNDIYHNTDFVAAEGSRWYESDYRRRFPKVDYIKRYKYQVWIHPISEWTSFDIWIYLMEHKITMNPIYLKGFQRTTCWLCPVVNPFHILCSQKYYPELWEKIPECRLDAFDNDETNDLPF